MTIILLIIILHIITIIQQTLFISQFVRHAVNRNSFCRDLDSIYKLIAAALAEPFEPVAEVDSEERELSRVQCSTSVLHQADQILRKLIAREMAENKGK